MKPRLLIITNRFVIGGPAYHVADLATRLQDDFEILVVGGVPGKGEQANTDMFAALENEPVVVEGFSRKASIRNDLRSYRKIKSIIKDFKPDIVHTHTGKPGIIGRIAARRSGVKAVVHTFHGNLFQGYFPAFISKGIVLLERMLARKTDAIIALSELQKKDLTEKYNIARADKIRVILPGIDSASLKITEENRMLFRERFNIGKDVVVPAIVGRLVGIKNIKLFILAVKHLREKGFGNVKGAVIGDGPLKLELKEFCNSIGLEFSEYSRKNDNAAIIFTSWCKNISLIYSGIDIVVLTSGNEGTPYSLIEAQMAGKPVVAARVGGVADIVSQGRSALLFDTRQQLFSALEKVVSDETLRQKMGEEGIAFARNRLDVSRMTVDTGKLYMSLIPAANKS